MPIKIPKKNAFYYEIANLRDRLIYWIPKDELENMVNNGEADKSIIKDYPFGVDIEVYEENMKEFYEKYEFRIPFDVKNMLRAFQAIKDKYGKKFPRTGFINASELENFAQDLKSEIDQIPELRRKKLPHMITKEPDRKMFRQQQKRVKKTKNIMRKLQFKGLDVKAPIQEQALFKVDMTKGEDAFDTLSRLHQHKLRRR